MHDEKYAAELRAVWKALLAYDRGQVVPWEVVEKAMGRARTDQGGWCIVRRLRRRLLRDREIATLVHPTVGLRLLTDPEAVRELPALRQRKAYRQVNRCLRELDVVNVGALSLHERQVLNSQRAALRQERLHIGRAKREAEEIRKTETLPIRK